MRDNNIYSTDNMDATSLDYAAILKSTLPKTEPKKHLKSVLGLAKILFKNKKYLQAAALYQYGINLCKLKMSKNEENIGHNSGQEFYQEQMNLIQEQLKNLKKDFFSSLKLTTGQSVSEEKDFSAMLTMIRKASKLNIEIFNKSIPQLKYLDELPKMIDTGYKMIADQMKGLIVELVKECHVQLNGPPASYSYAIIGLGSFSRQELTPYSDLEFAILVDQETDEIKDYFRHFTQLFHYKILLLGETILPAMAIPCLNNFYAGNDQSIYFFDSLTKRGFSLDGLMPHACKYPLGRSKTESLKAFELIHTCEKMAELRTTEFESELHMDTVLSNCVLLAGEQELCSNYRKQVYAEKHKAFNQDMACRLLKNSLTDFDPALQEQTNEGKIYHIKKDLYRLPSLLLEGLGLYFSLEANSNFELIDKLEEKKYITDESARHLKLLLALGLQMRLKGYLASDQQDDNLTVLKVFEEASPNTQDKPQMLINSLDNEMSKHLLMEFYFRLLPFHKVIVKFLSCSDEIESINILNRATFYNNGSKTKGLIYKRLHKPQQALSEFEQVKSTDIEAHNYYAILAMQLNDYSKAEEAFFSLNKQIDIAPQLKLKIKLNYANLLIHQCKYSEASDKLTEIRNYFENEHVKESNLAETRMRVNLFYTLGECERRRYNLSLAKKYFEKSLEIAEEIKLNKDDIYFSHTWNLLGLVNTELANYPEAITYFEKSLRLARKLYGNSAHYSLYPPLFNIAIVYSKCADYEQAKKYANYAKNILEVATIADLDDKVTIYSGLGILYDDLGESDIAKSYLENALNINSNNISILINLATFEIKHNAIDKKYLAKLQAIYDNKEQFDKLNPKQKSSIYNNLALALVDNDKKKVSYLTSALQELEKVHGKVDHPEIAKVLDNLGSIQSNHLQLDTAYKMRINFFKNNPHPDTVNSLTNLGRYYFRAGNSQQAVDCYKQALAMCKKLFNDQHPDVLKLCKCVALVQQAPQASMSSSQDIINYPRQ